MRAARATGSEVNRACWELCPGAGIGGMVERILQTHHFGPHRADVVEHADDEGTSYVVLVDGAIVTDPPLEGPPRLEDVVRIYAESQGQA